MKYESLSKEEKKIAKKNFKNSKFGKYITLTEIQELFNIIIIFLYLFTDFFDVLSIYWSVFAVIIIFVLNEFVHYKKNELIKEYYELKNQKK